MRIQQHFNYIDSNILTVAHIGVSNWEYTFVNSATGIEEAKSIMEEREFDVLPVLENNGEFKSFYTTWPWGNYSQLNKNQIDYGGKSVHLVRLSLDKNLFNQ